MKVLFTGANGFLGKNVIPKLKEYNFDITALGLENSDIICNLAKESPVIKDSFDIVFHAAGKAHTLPKTDLEKQEFYDINFYGTKNLCHSLENQLPKHFIFVSTVAVYGREYGINIREDEPLLGDTPYAKSKIMAENFLQDWCKQNNVKLTIFRPSLIAGHNPPGNLGDMINAIKKGFYFNISGGTARKSIIWVEDFADLINLATQNDGGVYNVTDSYHPSFAEIASSISKKIGKNEPKNIPLFFLKNVAFLGNLLGKKAPLNTLKLKKITESLTFSNEKIVKDFNWTPTKVLNKL